jgi:hypothetical protein
LDFSRSDYGKLVDKEFIEDKVWSKILYKQNNDTKSQAYIRTYGMPTAFGVPMLLATDPISATAFIIMNSIKLIEKIVLRRVENRFYSNVYDLLQARIKKQNTSISLVTPFIGLVGGLLSIAYMITNKELDESVKKAVVETQSQNAKKALKDNLPYTPLSATVAFVVGSYTHAMILKNVLPPLPAFMLASTIGAAGALYTMTNVDTYWPYVNSMTAMHVPSLIGKVCMVGTALLHMYANAAIPYMTYPISALVSLNARKISKELQSTKSIIHMAKRFSADWNCATTTKIIDRPFELETEPFGSYMIDQSLWSTNWALDIMQKVRYAPQGSKQQTKYIPLQYTMPKKENEKAFDEWNNKMIMATNQIIINAKNKNFIVKQHHKGELFSNYNQNSTIGYYGATTGLLKTDLVTYLIKNVKKMILKRAIDSDDEMWAWEMYIKNEILAKDKTRLLIGQTVPSKICDMAQRSDVNEIIYTCLGSLSIFVGINTIIDMGPYLEFMCRVFKYIVEGDWSRYDGRQTVKRMISQECCTMRIMCELGDHEIITSAIPDSIGRIKRTTIKKITLKGRGKALLLGAQASGDVMTTSGNSLRNYADQMYIHKQGTNDFAKEVPESYITVSGDDSLFATDHEPNRYNLLERSSQISQILKDENLIIHERNKSKPTYLSHKSRNITIEINGEKQTVSMLARSSDTLMWRFARSIEPYSIGKRYNTVMAQKCVSFIWSYVSMLEFLPAIMSCQVSLTFEETFETNFVQTEGYWLIKQLKGILSITTDIQQVLDSQFALDQEPLDYGVIDISNEYDENLGQLSEQVVKVSISRAIQREDWKNLKILKQIQKMSNEINHTRKIHFDDIRTVQKMIGDIVIEDIQRETVKVRHGKVYTTEDWMVEIDKMVKERDEEKTRKEQNKKVGNNTQTGEHPDIEYAIICKLDKKNFYTMAQRMQDNIPVCACCETRGILNPKYINRKLIHH